MKSLRRKRIGGGCVCQWLVGYFSRPPHLDAVPQLAFLPLAREAAAMTSAYVWVDGLILLRGLYDLVRQPESSDWGIYSSFPIAAVPFVLFLLSAAR